MKYCRRCDRPLTKGEVEDSKDIGSRVPLCADCADLAVWGAEEDDEEEEVKTCWMVDNGWDDGYLEPGECRSLRDGAYCPVHSEKEATR